MLVSFVIPTMNEELWLPGAIELVLAFPYRKELIIADNTSVDSTRLIAASSGCKVVDGGLPAFGRNAGARAATGSVLVFMDADVRPSTEALVAGLQRIVAGAAGVFYRYEPDTSRKVVNFAYRVTHLYVIFLRWLGITRGTGPLIIVAKGAFEDSGGFPEETAAAEDVEFIRRLARHGRVEYMSEHSVLISARRFRAENPYVFMLKCIMWGVLRATGLNVSIARYRWHHYDIRHRDPTKGW